MIQLQGTGKLDGVKLGKLLAFRTEREDPAIEIRFFLSHRPVFYTRPLRDWSTEPDLLVFPEAPGRYTLAAEWRAPNGRSGWEHIDFTVAAPRASTSEPHKLELDPETAIWIPNDWEGGVFQEAEKAPLELLESLIEPGAAVYDIGANVGVYSIRMARLAGPQGRLVCIEANPICVQYLRTNLLLAGLDNVDILPVAVLHKSGETRFTVNYGNSNLGLSEESGHYGVKVGHEMTVPCFRLDDLVDRYGLRPPDVIKMDVEGAEYLATLGMRRILETRRPLLMIELHGEDCAVNTLEVLDTYGYQYRDPASGDEIPGVGVIRERFAGSVFQLLALP